MGTMTEPRGRMAVAGMLKASASARAYDVLAEGEIAPLVEFAVERRRRTTDQLAKLLPAEFSQVDYTYKLRRRG